MNKFILPNIGEGIETVSISEIPSQILKNINKDDILLIVETDKASMEIPANFNGKIEKIFVKVGDFISPGQHILDYTTDAVETDNHNEIKVENNIDKPDTSNLDKNNNQLKDRKTEINKNETMYENQVSSHATPSIKKLARELGCDISKIKGSGSNNRITNEDVYNFVNRKLDSNKKPVINKEDTNKFINNFSKYGKLEIINLNKIQKVTASRLSDAWRNIPHVTQFDEIDITELNKITKLLKNINTDKNAKVSYLPFFIKSVSIILKNLSIFNTSLSPNHDALIQKFYYNIGIAVDTEMGLLVPVIKNVDKKSIKSISIEITKLANKARSGKLTLDEMSGGCITISSLGHIGGRFFTPIVNPPEVAILGISKIFNKNFMNKNSKLCSKKILPISLSYDHRVINGADAARFTQFFGELISNPSKIK